MENPTLLITGASGFVGTHLVSLCINERIAYFNLNRKRRSNLVHEVAITELAGRGVDVVIHLAGRAHILSDNSPDPVSAFYDANLEYTKTVAKAAVEAGLKRFVFVSTVGVYGLRHTEKVIDEEFPENPKELYAVTKLEAETWLRDYLSAQNVELVILRPSLIYGDNPPGNLGRLYKISTFPVPLPFKNANSLRTMLDVESFCRAILLCTVHPLAAGHTFNVADDEGVSTSQIVQCFRAGMGRESLLFSLPIWLVKCAFKSFGRSKMYEQLFESFYLDNTKLKTKLGWVPTKNPTNKLKKLSIDRAESHER